ncbi:unnamed protein product, partial [Prorocentrum cordatum]
CNAEAAHLNKIRKEQRYCSPLARDKLRAEEAAAQAQAQAQLPGAEDAPAQEAPPTSRTQQERKRLLAEARQRAELVGQAVQPAFQAPGAKPKAEETQATGRAADPLLDAQARQPIEGEPDDDERQPNPVDKAAAPLGDQDQAGVQQKAPFVQPQPQHLDDLPVIVTSKMPRKSMSQVGAMLHGGGVMGEDGGDDGGDIRSRKAQSSAGPSSKRDQKGDDFDLFDDDFDDGLGPKRK